MNQNHHRRNFTRLGQLILTLMLLAGAPSSLADHDHHSNQRKSFFENLYLNSNHYRRSNGQSYAADRGTDHRRHMGDYYTSPPLRGGSSRRTRVIENPYSNRLVTGITLTGIDDHPVHIKDVVAYPGRWFVSPLAYTLSIYQPPRTINTRAHIDYISVAAKRKEYFTVTFHYD